MEDRPALSPAARRVRRGLALLAVLCVLVTAVALVARARTASELPAVHVPASAVRGTTVDRYALRSRAADRKLVQTVVRPAGDVRGRPLLVLLHGKAQDPAWVAGAPLRAAVARLGDRAPVVLVPADDGGSYWHDRRSGRWATYLRREAIPAAVRRYGLDGRRLAVGGISMGGAGAYALAADGGFCAVGGHSPALWTSAGATAPGAYDDAEDFAAHDPIGLVRAGRARYGVPLWLDRGRDDPFDAADRAFVRALRAAGERVTVRSGPGGHEGRYWERGMATYLRFYADALAACRPAR
ncbi:alpha/beta hydrolase-fold protein [Patulibacter sp. SYSU D01012]|uniref:alpha/beta hydrolase n=1 Tax=Patulibacter sp. SYSU D01012 TaxID=2817381 RepID=UPI001B31892D|nr:alpha/beta hydrolase-fold protein [Patulibacter sp. SYSU D01012]